MATSDRRICAFTVPSGRHGRGGDLLVGHVGVEGQLDDLPRLGAQDAQAVGHGQALGHPVDVGGGRRGLGQRARPLDSGHGALAPAEGVDDLVAADADEPAAERTPLGVVARWPRTRRRRTRPGSARPPGRRPPPGERTCTRCARGADRRPRARPPCRPGRPARARRPPPCARRRRRHRHLAWRPEPCAQRDPSSPRASARHTPSSSPSAVEDARPRRRTSLWDVAPTARIRIRDPGAKTPPDAVPRRRGPTKPGRQPR